MLENTLFFIFGLAALTLGAELMVRGAARLALTFGISPLVVGLTIVALGTSAPEMAVSVGAALNGTGDLAIGNIVGSSIANILLILGLCALIVPLAVNEQIIRQEVPIMIGASLLFLVLALDGRISRLEGGLLFFLVIVYTVFLITQSRRASKAVEAEFSEEMPDTHSRWDSHWGVQLLLVVAGLGLLVLGAEWLVNAAVAVAHMFGVSDLLIGLTVVAVGTSMPEIATSLVAAVRGQRDIAVGNVVGSNVFNILAVLGFSSLVSDGGIAVSEATRSLDLWVMLAVAFACVPVMITGREIARWEGGVFIAYYVVYTAYLVMAAIHYEQLPDASVAVLGYLLPLTVITLVVSLVRQNGASKTP